MLVSPGDGGWQVLHGKQLVASGSLEIITDDTPAVHAESAYPPKEFTESADSIVLTPADIYKELSLRGYEYKAEFQDVRKVYDSQVGRVLGSSLL